MRIVLAASVARPARGAGRSPGRGRGGSERGSLARPKAPASPRYFALAERRVQSSGRRTPARKIRRHSPTHDGPYSSSTNRRTASRARQGTDAHEREVGAVRAPQVPRRRLGADRRRHHDPPGEQRFDLPPPGLGRRIHPAEVTHAVRTWTAPARGIYRAFGHRHLKLAFDGAW